MKKTDILSRQLNQQKDIENNNKKTLPKTEQFETRALEKKKY